MKVISAQNVDDGLYRVLKKLYSEGQSILKNSRNGPVLRFNTPCCIEWEYPMHRVSFDSVRDANPAFHLFESFWMLAGANDVKRPAYFASNLASYSDDGETMAGAYGYRWRHHFNYDQIDEFIIPKLRANREERRCVLQMWDPVTDFQNGEKGGKDLCCNLSVEFDAAQERLDMMVTNRSNDIVWGATGANIVHFSFLQEYIAGAIGLPVGRYEQVAMNMHLYTEFPSTLKTLQKFKQQIESKAPPTFPYPGLVVPMYASEIDPLLQKSVLDHDIQTLMDRFDQTTFKFESHFFIHVVAPVIRAYNLYKNDKLERAVEELRAWPMQSDWVLATTSWIQRRIDMRNGKIKGLAASSNGTVDVETWTKTLLSVWTSATQREVDSPVGKMLAFEAEVWNGKEAVLTNVGTWNDGMVTIRARGESH